MSFFVSITKNRVFLMIYIPAMKTLTDGGVRSTAELFFLAVFCLLGFNFNGPADLGFFFHLGTTLVTHKFSIFFF